MTRRALLGAAVVIAALATTTESATTADGPELTVTVTGEGRVTSSPAGIDCPPDCVEGYPRDASGAARTVRLTATPAAGHEFKGWGGACSGTGDCSVVMTANASVSAEFGPVRSGPPPPGTADLAVQVSAGGSVSGPGIGCPSDCAETVALGTTVPLTPTANPGFAFAGWQGACAGAGACAPAVNGPTYVRAEFAPVEPRDAPGNADADRDGVLDEQDRCPGTPRRIRVGPDGCAPAELLRDPRGALAPLGDAVGRALARTRTVPGLGSVNAQLARSLRRMLGGATKAGRGNVCGGARALADGARRLRSAAQRGNGLIEGLQRSVLLEPIPPAFGDAGEKDIRWADLHGIQLLVDEAAAESRGPQALFGRLCRASRRVRRVRGRVLSIDDESGLMRLNRGGTFVLPLDRAGRVWEGALARVRARGLGGGPALAQDVDVASAGKPALGLSPCMKLRIAPFQDFDDGTPVLHDPRGYRSNGVHYVEDLTRLAASPKCANAKQGRYSLEIELRRGNSVWVVAPDLTTTDDPVPLPIGPSPLEYKLVVKERHQGSNCPPPQAQPGSVARAAISYPCPPVVQSTTEYTLRIKPTGSYAEAVYAETVFGLEIDAPAPAVVTGLTGKDATLPANAVFEGEGFKPTGNQATGPITQVAQGETWALWPEVFYGIDDLLFPVPAVGVDHYAGLLWPRVIGTRNGSPFRYAAELPRLVTDRLAFCPNAAEDCFYMAPWPFQVAYNTNQGNGPGFSHNGNQLYAFDFGLDDGNEMVAARGGVVGDVVENLTQNYNPCVDPDADGLGNYVRVDHQDGTYAYYVHLKTNTVPPQVGDRIGRGAPIGQADNTGRSCGAHLHFQSSTVNTQQYYGQTTRIRFTTWIDGQSSPYAQDCVIPETGDVLISTNG